jgi:hypothetical protein
LKSILYISIDCGVCWFDKAGVAIPVNAKVAAGAIRAVTKTIGAAAIVTEATIGATRAASAAAIEGIFGSVFSLILFSALSKSI